MAPIYWFAYTYASVPGAFMFMSFFAPRYALPFAVSSGIITVMAALYGSWEGAILCGLSAIGCVVWPWSDGRGEEVLAYYPRLKRMVMSYTN